MPIHAVYGYHGTTEQAAEAILEDGFHVSSAAADWLGLGIYFWQDAPLRAWEWARINYGPRITLIRARIRLEDCMDLLDIHYDIPLKRQYQRLANEYLKRNQTLPGQQGGAHTIDREIVNRTVKRYATRDVDIRCVRAAFTEGVPVFPTSALYDRAHVQIAVIDERLITTVQRFRLP